jgi:S-adenosylhomocysteine hydrolase
VFICGYGKVGQIICEMLDRKFIPYVVIENSPQKAIEARNMRCNGFTRAIQQQSVSSGHYWKYFDDCSPEMQSEYLKTHKLPTKILNAHGVKIQKIDPMSKNILSTYDSKSEVVKKYQISYAKLNQLVKAECQEIYNGFIWKLC